MSQLKVRVSLKKKKTQSESVHFPTKHKYLSSIMHHLTPTECLCLKPVNCQVVHTDNEDVCIVSLRMKCT